MPRPYATFNSQDLEKNRIQENVDQSFSWLLGVSLSQGRALKAQKITSGTPLSINHQLSRAYQGWIVTKINANAVVWESPSSDSSKYLVLNSSATVTVDLWVF